VVPLPEKSDRVLALHAIEALVVRVAAAAIRVVLHMPVDVVLLLRRRVLLLLHVIVVLEALLRLEAVGGTGVAAVSDAQSSERVSDLFGRRRDDHKHVAAGVDVLPVGRDVVGTRLGLALARNEPEALDNFLLEEQEPLGPRLALKVLEQVRTTLVQAVDVEGPVGGIEKGIALMAHCGHKVGTFWDNVQKYRAS
jgi:hypothetical protein